MATTPPVVLLIEDELPIRRFLRTSLAAEDYRLVEAETGEKAIQLAAHHPPDLVVLDLATRGLRQFDSPVARRIVRTPAVSPDGSKVVFQVYRDGVWLLDVRDATMRPLLRDPSAEEFAWAPDGRRVAFHSRRDGQWGIYLLAAGS